MIAVSYKCDFVPGDRLTMPSDGFYLRHPYQSLKIPAGMRKIYEDEGVIVDRFQYRACNLLEINA